MAKKKRVVKPKLKLEAATKEQGKEFMEQANEWIERAPNIGMFNDCKSVTRCSVAEYIANQTGYSLWPIR